MLSYAKHEMRDKRRRVNVRQTIKQAGDGHRKGAEFLEIHSDALFSEMRLSPHTYQFIRILGPILSLQADLMAFVSASSTL